MHEVNHTVVFFIGAAVAIGALVRVLQNPAGANTLLAATVDTANGVEHGLEGKK